MITSLFKIVGLSLLSFCPFHVLADSSVNDYDLSANQVESVNIKKANINEDSNFININYNDSSFFENAQILPMESNIHGNVSGITFVYSLNGVEYSFIATNLSFFASDGFCYGLNAYTTTLHDQLYSNANICFGLKTGSHIWSLYIADYQYYPVNIRNLDYLKIYKYMGNSSDSIYTIYNNFYQGLQNYIYDNTSITISKYSLNNIQFNFTTNYLNTLNDSDLYPRALKSGVVSNGWLDTDYKMTFGDSEYWLSLGDNYRGFWIDDGILGQWTGDIVLYVGNTEIYSLLKANIENDINGNGLVYGDKFTISYGFNYNAPYNLNINDTLVSDSYFTSDTVNTYHKYFDYDMPYFISNGELFNRVRLEYINAYAIRYKIENQSDNVIHFPSGAGEGYGYFAHLWFSNTDTGVERIVYVRKFSQYLDNNNDLQTYLDRGGSWINTSYQYLDFYNGLSATQRNYLSQLNNFSSFNGLSNGGEVDLSSVFSLISSTLTSFTSFFNIGFLPGISLGMLILLPFGITLLLLIISLFKR